MKITYLHKVPPLISSKEYLIMIMAMTKAQLLKMKRQQELLMPTTLQLTGILDDDMPNTDEYRAVINEDTSYLLYYPRSQPFTTDELLQIITHQIERINNE